MDYYALDILYQLFADGTFLRQAATGNGIIVIAVAELLNRVKNLLAGQVHRLAGLIEERKNCVQPRGIGGVLTSAAQGDPAIPQAVDIGMVQKEDGIVGRAKNVGHATTDIYVNEIVWLNFHGPLRAVELLGLWYWAAAKAGIIHARNAFEVGERQGCRSIHISLWQEAGAVVHGPCAVGIVQRIACVLRLPEGQR